MRELNDARSDLVLCQVSRL